LTDVLTITAITVTGSNRKRLRRKKTMKCPKCKGSLKVTDVVSNPEDNEVYRSKVCTICGLSIYTTEFEVERDAKFRTLWYKFHRERMRKEG
jgi:transcriptional regulator NrdR family protein